MSIPAFPEVVIKKLSEELQEAVSQAELNGILRTCGLPLGEGARHRRIYGALISETRAGNHVLRFLTEVLAPVRFTGRESDFDAFRTTTNTILAFHGLQIDESGKARHVPAADTLCEAEERAGRLRAELRRRCVHPDVLRFCRAELLQQNYFHAILEATKSVAQKIRDRTGLTVDGHQLVDRAFSTAAPLLVWNALQTDSDRSEHRGTMDVLKGTFSLFRNPTAHEPKITRSYTEDEALELLTLVSLLHRRVDAAHRTHHQP